MGHFRLYLALIFVLLTKFVAIQLILEFKVLIIIRFKNNLLVQVIKHEAFSTATLGVLFIRPRVPITLLVIIKHDFANAIELFRGRPIFILFVYSVIIVIIKAFKTFGLLHRPFYMDHFLLYYEVACYYF